MSLSIVDNGDGTATIGGTFVVDNDDQSATILGGTDNGDGTVTLIVGGAGLAVKPEPGNWPPRMQLQLSGLSGTKVTILRVDPAGNATPVRNATMVAMSSGALATYDYDAPFNAAVTYRAVANTGSIYSADPVTLRVTRPWLLHPGIPALSTPLLVESVGDETFPTNQGVHKILGRADPITVTDGVRGSASFDLTVRTEALDDKARLGDLLADSSALLLQIVYAAVSESTYEWVAVGDVTRARLVPTVLSAGMRWTLPCTVVQAPSGLVQAQWTWADVTANYATWSDVKAAYRTWRDLILNDPAA